MACYLDPKSVLNFKRIFGELNDLLISLKKLPEELVENEYICQAAELCEEAGFTPEELAAYEANWDWIRVEKTIREGTLAKGRYFFKNPSI